MLDALLFGVRDVLVGGVGVPARTKLNFATGVSWADNPSQNRIDLTVTGKGLEFVTKFSGATLDADKLNDLNDNESPTPSFVLPAPASWTGRRIVAKRLNQAAAEVTLTAAGGALIDGAASYTLVGPDVCAEFFSDGTRILVGPTTGQVTGQAVIDTLPAAAFHLAPWDTTTLAPVSGAVQSATDRGGGSLVMTAANVASRPVLNLTGVDTLNGNPSVSFTYDQGSFSNGFRCLTGAPTGPVPQAMVCVSKYKSFDPSALQTLICAGAYDAGTTSWGAWIAATGAGAGVAGAGAAGAVGC